MKRSVLFLIIMCLCAHVKAQQVEPMTPAADVPVAEAEASSRPLIIYAMPNAKVHQDSVITGLLRRMVSVRKLELVVIPGYRLQIYSSNRQQTAKTEAKEIEKQFSQLLTEPIYTIYASPFWKVRVGNFRTAEEAQAYKAEFVKLYPQLQGDTYVVRDQIEVMQ